MTARSGSDNFEESLAKLKKQIADDERVINTLSQSKSEMNSKIQAMTKEKGQLEQDLSNSKAELKT